MAKLYYDKDANLKLLKGKTIAIMGYGSQGHAHALNFKDSGLDVIVGLYKGSKSWDRVKADDLKVATCEEAAQTGDIIMILLPDQTHKQVYQEAIERALKPGKTLMFAHGFNIHFHQIVPPPTVDVSMIAPKAPGHLMRQVFTEGAGVPALLAVHQDVSGKAKQTALAYAKGIGCTRAGVLETTFREETETDLFGEQTVLCGGVSALVKAAFETLVKAGYQPEVAYFECMHELKLIVDLLIRAAWPTCATRSATPRSMVTTAGDRGSLTNESRQRCRRSWAKSKMAPSPESGSSRTRPVVQASWRCARRMQNTRLRRSERNSAP